MQCFTLLTWAEFLCPNLGRFSQNSWAFPRWEIDNCKDALWSKVLPFPLYLPLIVPSLHWPLKHFPCSAVLSLLFAVVAPAFLLLLLLCVAKQVVQYCSSMVKRLVSALKEANSAQHVVFSFLFGFWLLPVIPLLVWKSCPNISWGTRSPPQGIQRALVLHRWGGGSDPRGCGKSILRNVL